MQVHDSQYTWLGLESQHPLKIGLVLPCGTVNNSSPLVAADKMPVNMPGYEDVRHYRDY